MIIRQTARVDGISVTDDDVLFYIQQRLFYF